MPYTTVVAGTTITAAWSNANNRDQVITPFASASARDSAITSPIEGMHAYLADTDKLMAYNGAAWVPAVSNIVARQTLTGNSSTFTTDATSDFALSGVVVRAERLYKVSLRTQVNLTALGTWNANLHVDGTLTDRMIAFDQTAAGRTFFAGGLLWEPTSGTKSLDIRVDEIAGTADLTFEAAGGTASRQFWVEDIGPR